MVPSPTQWKGIPGRIRTLNYLICSEEDDGFGESEVRKSGLHLPNKVRSKPPPAMGTFGFNDQDVGHSFMLFLLALLSIAELYASSNVLLPQTS
jgi:hypothetical protein